MKFQHRRKIKRYRKIALCEYAVIFENSNNLIEYVCNINSTNIVSSSLYTKDGYYQLLITAKRIQNLAPNIILKDKLHIDEIRFENRLICKGNAVLKMQKAFKST